MQPYSFLSVVTILLLASCCLAQSDKSQSWQVDGHKREAIIKEPMKRGEGKIPVIFVFHGHGGRMQGSARKNYQQFWPEAMIVCPQGLNTPGKTDPDGKKPGWQKDIGDQSDRDLHFVDAMLKTLKEKYPIDEKRIYVTGHSNGGGFTYLLWAARPEVFAAYAPSAAGMRIRTNLKPAPVMHLAGEKDVVVPFENQKRTIQRVRELNHCSSDSTEWNSLTRYYSSKVDAPFVSYIHPGDHKYPEEANALIVRFFKENARK